ncbi:hypothetical protein A3D11_03135 [Candidatus Peribacteria bacterium RIFCSPHIGHO2_02_FULL_49_16]|nr:MAG: hypothetical protein A2880_01425 [Candidatus Peribacteria bacterium RIFCSPHIGHO2_01_FULL_49_38]OGJ58577.1 MAG: hypothetical protein A3D11_03135 [Candidatus Peribacteria bacterium RIFCSPHIGHO2_02_FULL_49_16]
MECTLILLRPDTIQRRICGEIISDLEMEGRIRAMKMIQITHEQMRKHYAHILGQPFYAEFEEYMLSGPSMALILEGEEVIRSVRDRIGSIDEPKTIRGRFAKSRTRNVIHGSDSTENAVEEIRLFFVREELQELGFPVD